MSGENMNDVERAFLRSLTATDAEAYRRFAEAEAKGKEYRRFIESEWRARDVVASETMRALHAAEDFDRLPRYVYLFECSSCVSRGGGVAGRGPRCRLEIERVVAPTDTYGVATPKLACPFTMPGVDFRLVQTDRIEPKPKS